MRPAAAGMIVRASIEREAEMSLAEDAEPFRADGGPVGVVISHGFTGTPASLRPWAQYLATAGCSVRLPLLPGHGRRWQDTNRTRWQDWYGEIERAYTDLTAVCDRVFAAGLSMGGTLVTRLAEEKGDQLAGLVLVNPSYTSLRLDARLAKYVAWAVPGGRSIGGDIKKPGVVEPAFGRTPARAFVSLQKLWALTRTDFARITAPVLLLRSREDHVVEPASAKLLIAGATSTSVREIVLENSYHVATLDNDAPLIFETSLAFVREHAGTLADTLAITRT
jgi:carboxylesterase